MLFNFQKMPYFYFIALIDVLPACMSTRGCQSLCNCQLLCGCRELNLGPPEEQPVLLTQNLFLKEKKKQIANRLFFFDFNLRTFPEDHLQTATCCVKNTLPKEHS